MKTFILNFKNYQEVLGEKSLELARAAELVAKEIPVELVVAPPHPMLGLVAAQVGIKVFSQSVTAGPEGATTGAIVPESVLAAGGTGTLLNHSEAPMNRENMVALVPRLRKLGLEACICAKTSEEALELSRLAPGLMAIEPPELIGSGVAISKARPELVSDTVTRLRKGGFRGRILCGAGITDGIDVESAVALGAEGILVASSVVRAKDWASKIRELALPLI